MIKSTHQNKLKLMTWNARFLKNKVQELQQFLYRQEIDIACIQETHIYKKESTFIPGYTCIRKDKPTPNTKEKELNPKTKPFKTGLCIYIKNNIRYKKIPYNDSETSMDSQGITIEGTQNIINIYNIHQNPSNIIRAPELNHILNDNNNTTIIAGDWNSKSKNWNNTIENNNGKKLLRHAIQYGYQIVAPTQPTYIPDISKSRPSIMDFYIAKNTTNNLEAITVPDLNSDHNPVILLLEKNIALIENLHYNYKKANWDRLQKNLEDYKKTYTNIPLTPNEIEKEITSLTKTIQTQMKQCIPKGKVIINTYEIDRRTNEIIKTRNRARKLWQATRNPIMRALKNKLSKRVKYRIDQQKEKYMENEIKKLDNKDNTLWKNLNKFEKKKQIIHKIVSDNQTYTNDQEIAEAIAVNYEHIYKGNEQLGEYETEMEVQRSITGLQNEKITEETMIEYTNKTEITTIIKNLKNKKAPGEDGLQGIVIKKLPDNVIERLIDIFNSSIHHSYFPKFWKNAKIIPIHKPGKDPTQPTSYRPISLLPILSKIFEKIIKNRLETLNIKLTQDEQCGFKKNHSTEHQLCRIVQDVGLGRMNNKKTMMILLDIEKAFDKIWIDGLIHKLIQLQIPSHLIKIIQNYMQDRTFQVSYNNTLSNKKTANAGVIQGSVLGAILFNIYISDLPETKYLKKTLFADDTALYRTGNLKKKETLLIQKDLDTMNQYYQKWKIKINENKTEGIIFHNKKDDLIHKPTFNGTNIEWKPKVKYLGTILDKKLNWIQNVKYMRNKAKIGQSKIYRLINKKSKLKTELKILLYKAIIRPVITYAPTAWKNIAETNQKKLQVIQNSTLRIILNKERSHKTSELHKEAKIEKLREFQDRLIVNFTEKTKTIDNPQIQKLGLYNPAKIGSNKHGHKTLLLLPNKKPFTLKS